VDLDIDKMEVSKKALQEALTSGQPLPPMNHSRDGGELAGNMGFNPSAMHDDDAVGCVPIKMQCTPAQYDCLKWCEGAGRIYSNYHKAELWREKNDTWLKRQLRFMRSLLLPPLPNTALRTSNAFLPSAAKQDIEHENDRELKTAWSSFKALRAAGRKASPPRPTFSSFASKPRSIPLRKQHAPVTVTVTALPEDENINTAKNVTATIELWSKVMRRIYTDVVCTGPNAHRHRGGAGGNFNEYDSVIRLDVAGLLVDNVLATEARDASGNRKAGDIVDVARLPVGVHHLVPAHDARIVYTPGRGFSVHLSHKKETQLTRSMNRVDSNAADDIALAVLSGDGGTRDFLTFVWLIFKKHTFEMEVIDFAVASSLLQIPYAKIKDGKDAEALRDAGLVGGLHLELDDIANRLKKMEAEATACKCPAPLVCCGKRGGKAVPVGLGDPINERAMVRDARAADPGDLDARRPLPVRRRGRQTQPRASLDAAVAAAHQQLGLARVLASHVGFLAVPRSVRGQRACS
jgi:hypothetical protein